MSHHPGCQKNLNYYAPCTCAAVEQREHTEALNRYSQIVQDKVSALERENGELRDQIEKTGKRDEIADALKLCHRLRNGAARMTKEQFNAAMHKAIGADPAYCQGVRVNFQNNPAAFLAHRTPQIQSIELLRVLLDITRQPGDDGTTP
jgi:hypothetical protein